MSENLSVVTITRGVNQDLVTALEGLLEQAREGTLVSGHFCGTLSNGEAVTSVSSSRNQLLEIAAASRLLHRLHMASDTLMTSL